LTYIDTEISDTLPILIFCRGGTW